MTYPLTYQHAAGKTRLPHLIDGTCVASVKDREEVTDTQGWSSVLPSKHKIAEVF